MMKNYCVIFLVTALVHLETTMAAAPQCDTIISRLEQSVEKLKKCSCTVCKYESCEEVFKSHPDAKDGYYDLTINDKLTKVYCKKKVSKCGDEEGWARVYKLDMTKANAKCPGELTKHDIHGKGFFCDRDHCGGGSSACNKAILSVLGLTYATICGRVRGYQYDGTGRVEGIYDNTGGVDGIKPNTQLKAAYVDGVSITLANMTQHVFTLIAGQTEVGNGRVDCPCNEGSKVKLPDFVDKDYYCESAGAEKENCNNLYNSDPLWDGDMCKEKELTCCSSNKRMPFFRKDLETTDEDIEFRICSSEGYPDEGTPIDQIEIYVR